MATKQSTIDYLLDQLFLKPTNSGRSFPTKVTEGAPYLGAKPHLLITADLWEDREWLSQLVEITASELPEPKPRKPRA